MSAEITTTLNLIGKIEVALQGGTEKVNLSELLKEPTTLIIKGGNWDAQIDILPPVREGLKPICRIGLIIRE